MCLIDFLLNLLEVERELGLKPSQALIKSIFVFLICGDLTLGDKG